MQLHISHECAAKTEAIQVRSWVRPADPQSCASQHGQSQTSVRGRENLTDSQNPTKFVFSELLLRLISQVSDPFLRD